MKKLDKRKLAINDIAIFLIIVFTLAFHNYSVLLAVVQLIGCFFIYLSYFSKKNLEKNKFPYLLWKLIFTTWSFMSLLWAKYSSNVLSLIVSVLQVTMVGYGIILYMNDTSKVDKIINFIKIACLVLITRMIIEVPISAWGTDRVGVYIGYGGNGAALVLSYAALLLFFLYTRSKKKQNIVFCILFVAFALFCGSKKALIICILGIGLQMIAMAKNPIDTVKKIFKVLIVAFILIFAVMNFEPLYNVLGARIEKMFLALSGESGGDMSTKDRMLFAQVAFDIFKAHPILGLGLDNYRFHNYMGYYAHNNYLEIAADLGIIGLISYYWFLFKILINSLKKYRYSNYIFISIFVIIILIMDVANVSYFSDSIQLYIAIIYGIFLLSSKLRGEDCEKNKINNVENSLLSREP